MFHASVLTNSVLTNSVLTTSGQTNSGLGGRQNELHASLWLPNPFRNSKNRAQSQIQQDLRVHFHKLPSGHGWISWIHLNSEGHRAERCLLVNSIFFQPRFVLRITEYIKTSFAEVI